MPSVAEYMSPAPPFVEADEPLWAAERIMRSFGLEQLPVVARGELCGVLTARDTRAMAAARGTDRTLTVGETMSTDFYVVRPLTPLAHVLRTMASHDYLCALVVEGEKVQGILTTAQALAAGAQLLEREPAASAAMDADEVRAVILAEHAHVRMLLWRTRAAASAVRSTVAADHAVEKLYDAARLLVLGIEAHLHLENRVLGPSLARQPRDGEADVAEMVAEHRRQLREVALIVEALGQRDRPASTLARQLDDIATRFAEDLARNDGLLFGTVRYEDKFP